jgi:hypothetical protein
MGKFAQGAAKYNTGRRGEGVCTVGKWIAKNFDEEDLAEFTRLANAHKWRRIQNLSDHNLKEHSLNHHVHGACVCVGDTPAKGCCNCPRTAEES